MPLSLGKAFVWQVVRRGVRWRIGSGVLVDMWRDNWLPRDFHFKPYTPNFGHLQYNTVDTLRIPDANLWNEDLIRSIFWSEDADIILQIPLASPEIVDT